MTGMGDASVEVVNVGIDFPLYHGTSRSLKQTIFSAATGRLKEGEHSRLVVQSLREISFTLKSGDRLGLIGGNGAGKTTLLRVMAGAYEPVSGHVRVHGSLYALLDSSFGSNPNLSGRENIRLRGLYTGMTSSEIRNLEEDVQDFAELGDFINIPVRSYSSGMMVRLSFALATAIQPQVLLMDEWLMAGDAAFMDKARRRVEGMVSGAEILVLSSHSPEILRTWCDRLSWIEKGRIRGDGTPDEILERYLPPNYAEPVPLPVQM
jgi:lipopolysaccharide transport system ATP-binding protein